MAVDLKRIAADGGNMGEQSLAPASGRAQGVVSPLDDPGCNPNAAAVTCRWRGAASTSI